MANSTKSSGNSVSTERKYFLSLLLTNPNYFGNLADSALKPVQKIIGNTSYEELECVGFNPELSRCCSRETNSRPHGDTRL